MKYELGPDENNAGATMVALENELISVTERSDLPDGVSHNLACLSTLWKLGFFDDLLYEQAERLLPDSPDFVANWTGETNGRANALQLLTKTNAN